MWEVEGGGGGGRGGTPHDERDGRELGGRQLPRRSFRIRNRSQSRAEQLLVEQPTTSPAFSLTLALHHRHRQTLDMAAAAVSRSGAPAGNARPNHTLYCSNLPDKLQKDDLKRSLYMLFSVYGPILDIVALKTPKMRGQAHVLFRDVSASSQAMRGLQGFDFFGKDMVRLRNCCCSEHLI